MAKRRGHGEGSIYQRGDNGRWVGAVDLGYQDGKRKRKYVSGKTRRAVADKMKALLWERERVLPPRLERQTLGEYLRRWLETSAKPTVRPSTFRSCEMHIRVHIIPTLGRMRLTALGPEDVQRFLNAKLAAGLAPSTVCRIRATLRRALGQAMKWGHVQRNVAALVDSPKTSRRVPDPFGPAEARRFLHGVRGDRLEALLRVCLGGGPSTR